MNRATVFLFSAAAALVAATAAAAYDKPPQTVNAGASDQPLSSISFESITVEASASDSNFTLIDSRFEETAAAGAFFGIIGAGVSSGIAAGEDDKKADRFREGAAAIDLSGLLTSAASEALAARANPPLAEMKDGSSHVLVIEIRNWGLIRVERDDPRLRAFLNLSWRILDGKGKTVFEKKRENSVSSAMRLLDEYSDESLKSEIESLATKAGRQVAYQIIYR
jgi:opacity protein-like surface antigen